MTFDEFLSKCTACGGNLTAMLITGIKAVAPDVYEQMPDRSYSFDEAGFIVNHLCHDRPHFRFNISLDGEIIEHSIEGKFVFRKATDEERGMSPTQFHKTYNDPFYVENPVEVPGVLDTMLLQ